MHWYYVIKHELRKKIKTAVLFARELFDKVQDELFFINQFLNFPDVGFRLKIFDIKILLI